MKKTNLKGSDTVIGNKLDTSNGFKKDYDGI